MSACIINRSNKEAGVIWSLCRITRAGFGFAVLSVLAFLVVKCVLTEDYFEKNDSKSTCLN